MPNAFEVMGQVRKNMKRSGKTDEEIAKVLEDMKSGDYDHLLEVASEYLD